jgi:hypothetical protein
MGADDAITSELVHTNGAKIVKFDTGLIVGFAGSLATQNVMARPGDALANLTAAFNDEELNLVFDRFQTVAHFPVKGAADATFWGQMLLAMGSSIVCMANLGGWYRVTDDFRCIGEGSRVATGAMDVLRDLAPRERIARSIEAASKYVPGVGKMAAYETTTPRVVSLSDT